MFYFTPALFSLAFIVTIVWVSVAPAEAVSRKYRDLSQNLTGQAETELSAERAQQADAMLNLALTADPANAEAYMLKGRAQKQLGNPEEGLRLMNISLEISPGNVDGLLLQGKTALEVGDLEQAGKSLRQIEQICGVDCAAAEELTVALDTANIMQQDDADKAGESGGDAR